MCAEGAPGSRALANVAFIASFRAYAHVAQLAEHTLGKGEVTGSIPVVSSLV